MSDEPAVTQWIAGLKLGDEAAARQLWEHYFQRLVALARAKLAASARRAADEEDVALSAFKSLCCGAANGRFPRLHDRDHLWPLLVVMTVRKSRDLCRLQGRQKRGGNLPAGDRTGDAVDVAQLLDHQPTPELAAMLAENYARLLDRLDAEQRQIAEMKLAGFTNPEIAAKLGCGLRTIDRRLQLIRRIWDDANPAANADDSPACAMP